MKVRIREGNDFDVVWAIKRAGQPEDLSTATSMKLTLVVYGLVIEHELFTVADNLLSINIPKEVATIKGDYRLVFEYTLPDAGQPDGDLKCKTDVVPFRIVPFTADADDIYTINVTSDIAFGFKGEKGEDGDDAYQIWLDLGNEGTYEDFIAYMRQPAVDAGASIAALELIIDGNESGRVTAEGERDAAEILRLSAESGRAEAEGLRDVAEEQRIAAEGVRDDNEGDRITAESDRADAEELRDGAELIRLQSEIGRNTAEGLRVNAETGRNTAEGLRASAETGRNTAEGTRVTQESARQTNTATAISGANEAAQSANTAAGLANTARENIQADLALKAAHGYASDPKTLKEVDDEVIQLAGDVEQITKSQAIQILKQLDGSLIFQGFAKPDDDTPAATVNHAYYVIESGTVFGVAATEGQIIYSDGEDFHVKDYLPNRFLTDIEKYLLPGYYIAPDGTYYQGANYTVVDKFIPVLEGMELEFYRSTGIRNKYDRIAFYDNEFKIVSAHAIIEGIVVCPENACYFKYNFLSSLPVLYFNVKKEILNLYVNKNELQEFNNANEQVYSTSLFHPEFSVGYFGDNGFESEDVRFKKTSHIPVIPGRTYLTNALYRFKKYDIFRRELGIESITEGAITIGDGVYFIRIFFNASDEPIFKDSENVLNGIEHSTISKERHLNIKVKTPNKVQTSLSSLPDLQRIEGKVVSGEIGKKGTVYSIPFSTQGVYKVQFEIQLPSDVNNVDETIVVADLPPASALNIISDGGFCIEVVKALPTADALYPKIKFNSGLRMRPTVVFNNYSSYYFPEVPLKPFYGEDAFSIRFVGDISITENRDVQLDIDDTGIHIYHSTTDTSIIDIPFPVSKSLAELAQHIIDETQEGGNYNGIIDFEQFSVHDGNTTDDIIRISGIKLVADYEGDKGWQAFPFYAHLVDYSFHKIEVVINKFGEGRRKTYMYYDGQKVMPIDSNITFTQIENYSNMLTLGHADVELKNYLYEEDVVLSSEPFLYMYMLHGVNADVSAEGAGNSSLRRLKELIDLHKKYGFAYVSIDDIRDWWNGKKELPRKCWSVIHDDAPHLTITENKTPEQTAIINKARRLYHSNGIQAAFALIEDWQTDTGIIEQINKDRFFKFVIHDYDHDVIMPDRTYDDLVEKTDLAIDTHRANHETSVDWVYIGGQFDYNTLKFLSARGMQTAWLVGPNLQNTLGCVTKAWYSTSLPRHNGDDQNDIVTIEDRLKG